ncbi:PadR family transcriptional regulator PadR [Chromobacterium alkanivorans]|uniref:PadR family transcriptional regulator n=1 Tax=Chromobacterium TaxID=535 RepID=UPI000654663E|nr:MULTISPECIES: PadR family transcriptional regulator [Chromobacterium]KMN81818.1 PadR family transcriptional regulator [Chromobacterium sp. LK11]MBN3002716.1 PadR family transcriptional regulator [Chromobacterium alkanivorans]MCS3802605.1 PadR family transcriptional regulator PadR [Chromobacterium alkanivorans]MCS3816931.1 PadR family transcriptional regulator PadR [Chromobacterium alkanivorans]MCS3871971.1 PadR family transcriptional regulator PadR [Chromobacterium alkanivorans]
MKTQLKKGTLDMCVLAVLAQSDSYAYELVSTLSRTMEISEGTIYPLMRRLQNESWVSTYLVESASGPSRKYYALTEAGKRELELMRREWQEFVSEVGSVLSRLPAADKSGEQQA